MCFHEHGEAYLTEILAETASLFAIYCGSVLHWQEKNKETPTSDVMKICSLQGQGLAVLPPPVMTHPAVLHQTMVMLFTTRALLLCINSSSKRLLLRTLLLAVAPPSCRSISSVVFMAYT